jgi:hypothetical protein
MSLYNVDHLALGDCIQNPSTSVIAILRQRSNYCFLRSTYLA